METTMMKQCKEELRRRLENVSKVTAIELIKKFDSQKEAWNTLEALTNSSIYPQREVGAPDKIKDIYSKANSNRGRVWSG